jgi:hypothetical protein
VLRAFGAAIAKACVGQIYATWPDLLERYGERGRHLTAEDNVWHLNFLDASVALGDPEHFRRYATWLVEFFAPRGLGPEHVAGAFRFLADGLAAADVPVEHEGQRRELIEVLRETRARILAPAVASVSGAARPDEESPDD